MDDDEIPAEWNPLVQNGYGGIYWIYDDLAEAERDEQRQMMERFKKFMRDRNIPGY